ncbi:MAG TPA: glycosyl hydrolase family 28-related protein, partial [Phycisphaerae bacterium]|nr:glycosyl hydrolase family 28-related protein [Phycisphaerae bacterium]
MPKLTAVLLSGLICFIPLSAALAQAPQIANVYPDFLNSSGAPQVITGENLDAEGLELRTWSPPSDEQAIRAAAEKLTGAPPKLPAAPPQGSGRAALLDVEKQVVVARLTGTVLWAVSKPGISKPYLLNVARPFWCSHDRAQQGTLLHVYGFGLRDEHSGPSRYARKPGTHIVLKNADRTIFAEPIREGRSTQWIADGRLVYFRVPGDTPPGKYTLYIHNGHGGELGWAKVAPLEVIARAPAAEKLFDVRKHEAKGDGLANDLPALRQAMAAAQKAGGGIVFLPPGTYRIDETLSIPAGVALRGAGRENTLLKGTGLDRAVAKPAAVVQLADNTALDSLTVCGGVAKGLASGAMIQLEPAEKGGVVRGVSILNCRIRALEEDPDTRDTMYLRAIVIGRCRDFKFNNNEIHGSLWFQRGERMEIVRNKWYDGTATIVVSIHGWAFDSLLDSNLFTDAPGRVCFYPVRHCYIRFNEVHQAFRGTWTNAEEVFLVHGGVERRRRTVGMVTDATATQLRDKAQDWAPGLQKDSIVLILSGKGFGQYRKVADNTADTLTVETPWRVVPDATSEYVVGWMYSENAFFANLNNTPLRMSLWLDCVANVVDRHRDAFSKGVDACGGDESGRDKDGKPRGVNAFHPSWYNMFVNGWMDGAYAHLSGGGRADNLHSGPPFFGNYICKNRIRSPHMQRTGFDHHVLARGGVVVGGSRGDMTQPQDKRVALSHNIVAGNQLSFTSVGISVSDYARKTFILGNLFQRVDKPILDWG